MHNSKIAQIAHINAKARERTRNIVILFAAIIPNTLIVKKNVSNHTQLHPLVVSKIQVARKGVIQNAKHFCQVHNNPRCIFQNKLRTREFHLGQQFTKCIRF